MSSCNFLEVCRDVTKTARKIPQSDYLPQGNYKIFDQGKQYIAGYRDDSEGVVSDCPYIVFGDHTRILKYVTEPCFIGADGVKLLKVYNEDFIPQYVFYALLAQPIENQGYSRHFKYLKELNIAIYTKEEQNAIVSELDKVQAALANKKEQLKKLDELIQSKFYEMFGDPVMNDKGWDTEKLNKVAPECTSTNNIIAPFWLLNLDMIESNTGKVIRKLYSDNRGTSTFAFDVDNVLYSKLRPYLNKVVTPDESGFATTELVPLKPNKDILNRLFLSSLLRSEQFVSFANSKSGGAKMPRISMAELRNYNCILPPLPLQQAFAAYVEKVEQAKAIVSQEIAHLQELLDSRMDYYFRK